MSFERCFVFFGEVVFFVLYYSEGLYFKNLSFFSCYVDTDLVMKDFSRVLGLSGFFFKCRLFIVLRLNEMTTIQSSFGLIVSLSTSISIWCMKVARE